MGYLLFLCEALRENSTLPCNNLHGKEHHMHGKAFAVRHRTAKITRQ
jgi:hypothetical protein